MTIMIYRFTFLMLSLIASLTHAEELDFIPCDFVVTTIYIKENVPVLEKAQMTIAELWTHKPVLFGENIERSATLHTLKVFSTSQDKSDFCPSQIYFGNKALKLSEILYDKKKNERCQYEGLIFGSDYYSEEAYREIARKTFNAYSKSDSAELDEESHEEFVRIMTRELDDDILKYLRLDGFKGKEVSVIYCSRYHIENSNYQTRE
ncbi:MAG: hypothetical protein KDD35_03850 [Bdellovibrionales bacterium]|nr:hypothetical protein [Bdellovibrionales bacterium]